MHWFIVFIGTSFIQVSLTSPLTPSLNKTTKRLPTSDTLIQKDRTVHDSAAHPTLLVTNNGQQVITGSSPSTRQRQAKQSKIDISHLFREEVANYPDHEIRRLLKQTSEELKNLYNVIDTPLDPNANLTERVAHYYGEEDDSAVREEAVCRTVKRNIYPREANRQNSLVYIPNNQEFMQVIQAELCLNPNEECSSYLRDSLPYGMTSICYQKYAYKKLLFMDPLEKRMATDLFRYPSCCSCYLRTLPFDLRTGTGRQNATLNDSAHHTNGTHFDAKSDGNKSSDFDISLERGLTTNQHKSSSGKQKASSSAHNQTLVLADDKVYLPV